MTTMVVAGGSLVGPVSGTARIVVDQQRIVTIEPTAALDTEVRLPHPSTSSSVLDATGCWVVPGYIDVQVNGAVGVDLTTEPQRIAEVAAFLPQCGVTSFMPTVIASPLANIGTAIATMQHVRSGARSTVPSGARSLGVHIEGPFLHPRRRGAHPQRHLREPSIDAVAGWSSDTGVAMVTIAPELPQATEVIALLVERGVVVSIGHTEADPRHIDAAVRAGARSVTHLFNAMAAMSARSPGSAAATLTHSHLIAGMIVDGLHVDRTMVQLAWRALGPDRIALVSDAMAALGLPHGSYAIGDTPVAVDDTGVRTTDGVLAGSVLRFDQAVRSLMAYTGCDLAEASRAASATPARLAGVGDIGRLEPGWIADLVLLDDGLRVVATVVAGHVVWDPQQRWSCGVGREKLTSRGSTWRS